MRCLLRKSSSATVSTSSWPLRSSVRSPDSSRFFASCCVIVEPPRRRACTGAGAGLPRAAARAARLAASSSARALRWRARSIASHSTPSWLMKSESSLASTARLRLSWICAYGNHCWRHCARAPSRSTICHISERWKAVDCGSIAAIAAMRSTKKSSSASPASSRQPIQRTRGRIGVIRPRRRRRAARPAPRPRAGARRATARRPRPPARPACPARRAARRRACAPRP